jgi:hypothetical protein
MDKVIIACLMAFLMIACGRTTVYPNDKKTKFIFINQTGQSANLIGLKNNKIVKDILVEDSSSSEFELVTQKTFAVAEDIFNNPDSFLIRFEKINKTTIFTLQHIDFAHKSAMDPNAYTRNKISDDYMEKTYFITQELLDSAK